MSLARVQSVGGFDMRTTKLLKKSYGVCFLEAPSEWVEEKRQGKKKEKSKKKVRFSDLSSWPEREGENRTRTASMERPGLSLALCLLTWRTPKRERLIGL